ncbi:MAG: nuclear transport factor 2 family protein [Hyphomonadaceae bacterium]|nr:nuclear transport factor 2 family protein [Hyphomonadaceae bacterium]
MRRVVVAAFAVAAGFLLCAPALAQNLSLRAPAWAQPLVATDIIPTTGGRAVLATEGVDVAARLSIAPARGGVARVVRFELAGERANLHVRRLTGHPTSGWWLWGSDAPLLTPLTPAQGREIAALVRSAMGVGGSVGADQEVCLAGEQAYLELFSAGRSISATRACVGGSDPVGRLALRLSELGGSRTEEELAAAAVAEVMAVDRAFAAMAQAQGVPAAFGHYAAPDALILSSASQLNGRDAIVAHYATWPEGARLEWTPEAARVSARGDMAWSWGNSVLIAPDGARTPGRYVSVWTRDYEGNWRYAFDGALR